MRSDAVLATARFDTKLRTYLFLGPVLTFAVTIIGIPMLLIVIPVSWWWARRYFDALSCTLTPRALVVKRGTIFRSEKSIPLDKITDLTLRYGPLLSAFGLCALRIETAGQSQQPGGADASLTGIVNAREFRDLVLEQRDLVADYGYRGATVAAGAVREASGAGEGAGAGAGAARAGESTEAVLAQIRDALLRIEERIGSGVV